MADSGVAVVVREGRTEDRPFVEDLGKRTMGDSVARFRYVNEAMLEASYDGLLDFVFRQSHMLFIAERGGKRAGFILLLDTMPDEVTRMPQAFIAYMAVEPSARCCGIGSRLLAAAEDWARRRGLPYMGLMVTEDNAAARALYERAGFLTERRLLCKPL
ncbi:MAG TPA: GNAT family N-acetyltransferase [Candidatus Baltobacteraceae bacterium]|nr:GNAT family N-acetyltransferase [Candidatus Baltobacteraceae bacterium]